MWEKDANKTVEWVYGGNPSADLQISCERLNNVSDAETWGSAISGLTPLELSKGGSTGKQFFVGLGGRQVWQKDKE